MKGAKQSNLTGTLDQLLCELEPDRGEWKKQNEGRRSIADQIGVPAATFTTRIKSGKTQMRDAIRASEN